MTEFCFLASGGKSRYLNAAVFDVAMATRSAEPSLSQLHFANLESAISQRDSSKVENLRYVDVGGDADGRQNTCLSDLTVTGS